MIGTEIDSAVALVLITAKLEVSKATEQEIVLATRLLKEFGHINSAACELRKQLRE